MLRTVLSSGFQAAAEALRIAHWLFSDTSSWALQKIDDYCYPPGSEKAVGRQLDNATSYEEWLEAARHYDSLVGNEYWRFVSQSSLYDHALIEERSRATQRALEEGNLRELVRIIRTGLVRNLGNITVPRLYNGAYAGTKYVIEGYVDHVVAAVETVRLHMAVDETGLTKQEKMDLFAEARISYGRTCLLLQGGSVFGLCHFGVVKALYLHDLLPRHICGNATGALMAALVCCVPEKELLGWLSSEKINLEPFAEKSAQASEQSRAEDRFLSAWFPILAVLGRRVQRFRNSGYVLDPKVLKEVVDKNVGDITFDEAYKVSGRILNITITTDDPAVPTLLNYITAPDVLVRTAAMASNSVSPLDGDYKIQCKAPDGTVINWPLVVKDPGEQRRRQVPTHKMSPSTDHDRTSPLSRLKELFDINHFIVSQARPYLAPFLAPSLQHSTAKRTSRASLSMILMQYTILEIRHRLMQLDQLDLLPQRLRRVLIEESVPAASWVVVPKIKPWDFLRLLRNPTKEDVDYWVLQGERSVWPALTALQIRCDVEIAIDRAYQLFRRWVDGPRAGAQTAADVGDTM